MNGAMDDKRLSTVRRGVQALIEHAQDGGALSWAEATAPEMLAEIDRLRAWKAEAMAVHSEWEATWQAAGRPGRLGASKAIGVRQEIDRLRAEITRCGRRAEESSHM